MGSTSKIPLHKGEKAAGPVRSGGEPAFQTPWRLWTASRAAASLGWEGQWRVTVTINHPRALCPLRSAGGAGAGRQAEQVNQRNVEASAGGRRWEGALRILRGIVMLWGMPWWEWEEMSVLGPGTVQINSIPRTSEFIPVLSHHQD